MTEPLVSAIVSTYNSERFIRGCLEDLEAQTIADRLEIIVIDACSPQAEGAIVAEFQQRYDNIRYVRTDMREPLYASWNRGIRMARGKYVTNANTDDRHRRDAMERLANALERDPGAALAYADVAMTMRENATFDDLRPFVFLRFVDFDARRLFQVPYCGPQPMWRRDLHDRYGFFDADLVTAGDYEWWLRLCVRERFIHVPEVLGLYLAAPQSIEHRHPEQNWQESERARERHWPKEWGPRPRPHGVLQRFDVLYVAGQLLRGNAAPLREVLAHGRMLVHGRFNR